MNINKNNKTGIPGIHKFKYNERKPGVKKRFSRPNKWVVQCCCKHICICTDFDEAVKRRYEAEKAELQFNNKRVDKESKAYLYLKKKKKSKINANKGVLNLQT